MRMMLPMASNNNHEKHHFWRNLFIQFVLIVAVYFGVQAWQSRHAPKGTAPIIYGQLLDGRRVSLDDYRGKPVLVHFWATWCSICRFEQDSIESIAEDYVVIAVASQSGSRDEVEAYAKENGLNIPVLVDEEGKFGDLYGVRAFPSSYVIDTAGQITDVEIGYSSEWGLRARLFLAGY